MTVVLARHDEIVSSAIGAEGGTLLKQKGEGDSTFSVFSRASDAVRAGYRLQRAMAAEPWPLEAVLRTRVAIHTGEAIERDGDYFGPAVNLEARLRGAASGGQLLLSGATAGLVGRMLPDGCALVALGVIELRGIGDPEAVFAVRADNLDPVTSMAPPTSQVSSAAASRRRPLPSPRSSFIGRHTEITAVSDLFEQQRLVTLTGIGGCGKTRLAFEIARSLERRFSDGVIVIELAAVDDPALVAQAAATACGVLLHDPSIRSIAAHLATRSTLVLIDNCEHLIDACAELADEL